MKAITTKEHYKAFDWCTKNGIKIYPKPRGSEYILVYSENGVAKTSGTLYSKKEHQQKIWDFYLYLYKKYKDV